MKPDITKDLDSRRSEIKTEIYRLKSEGLEALKNNSKTTVNSNLQLINDLNNELEKMNRIFESEVRSLTASRLRYLNLEIRYGTNCEYSKYKTYPEGHYNNNKGWQVYTQELIAQELEALNHLTKIMWEQNQDGRLYYKYTTEKDYFSMSESDGKLTAKALSHLFPKLLYELKRIKDLEAKFK